MVVRGPVGLVGKPEGEGDFTVFEFKGVKFHLEKELLEFLSESCGDLKVSMGEYGLKKISFCENKPKGKRKAR